MRPLLLLDVDGVLMPLGRSVPRGFERHTTPTADIVVSELHGVWLRALCQRFDVVWASTWGDRANDTFGVHWDLPRFPTIELTGLSRVGTRKLMRVSEFVGDRAFAWVDDEIYEDAEEWAVQRVAPTMLIRTAPYVGLTEIDFERLEGFASPLA